MLRPAVVADAAAITRLQYEGWLTAYRGIMPDDLLDGLDFEERRARWHDGLANGATVLLSERGDTADGFVAYGPCRDADRIGAGEVFALYVDKGRRREGVGERLLAAAVEALRAEGYSGVVLWVLRDNAPARRFYEKQGWAFDGTEKLSPWGPVESRYECRASA